MANWLKIAALAFSVAVACGCEETQSNRHVKVVTGEDGVCRVYRTGGEEPFVVDFEPESTQKIETQYFFDWIDGKLENDFNPPEGSALTIKLVNTLVESSNKNGEVVPFTVE